MARWIDGSRRCTERIRKQKAGKRARALACNLHHGPRRQADVGEKLACSDGCPSQIVGDHESATQTRCMQS